MCNLDTNGPGQSLFYPTDRHHFHLGRFYSSSFIECSAWTEQTEQRYLGAAMGFSKVIEKFGVYFDEVGLSKTYGRMFGFFMTSTQPISMRKLVENLRISKSTASIELRRLLTMGVIEKISLPDERADYYRLKNNIWSVNLNQKIQDIKKLRAIIEEIPSSILEDSKHLKEMASYCIFLEAGLEILTKRYMNFQMEKNQMETMNSGSYIEQGKENQSYLIE